MNSAIRTLGLGFSYRTFRIEDLSIEFAPGSFVCIAGPNGSGKSTLSRLLGSVLEPQDGVVEASGHVGLVLQNPDNQFVSEIVEDDVAFGPENLGHPENVIRQEVDSALERTGMLSCAKRPVSELSYGQKQRTGIAGLLALNPAVLVLDEVTSMMDSRARTETISLIMELRNEGCTVILITHNMEDAVRADRLILMKDGRIAADGKPAQVFNNPQAVHDCALQLPFALRIVHELEKEGINLGRNILTYQDLKRRLEAYLLHH